MRPKLPTMVSLLVAVAMTSPEVGLPATLPCGLVAIELDPSQAGGFGGSYLGRCVGQSFFAPETLVTSLTVWRAAIQAGSVIGMHLFLTEADSSGSPFLDRIVLDGPTVFNLGGDGVTPTPFTWTFDPPVVLPRVGYYAFFLCQDPCHVYFDVITTPEGVGLYPDGIILQTGRSFGCDLSSGYADEFPLADIIFRMEFCSDLPTPARPQSWGRLKQIYR